MPGNQAYLCLSALHKRVVPAPAASPATGHQPRHL